ncbi:hypothetical protein Z947_1193 [Sulfitobacter geojensis]|nr:hypothetical protein Z947_1193 [Sulfitobacter geojensis]
MILIHISGIIDLYCVVKTFWGRGLSGIPFRKLFLCVIGGM